MDRISEIVDNVEQEHQNMEVNSPYRSENKGKKLFLESYGCAMNFADSEVVASILTDKGFSNTLIESEADIILINTCSIRENAEERIRKRLTNFKNRKKRQPNLIVGILGCMAERLKQQLLEEEKLVDLIAGPDSYRSLPDLIKEVEGGQKAVNVLLSRDETYANISPVRLDKNGITGFVSITRGCDNMCSFCVVPFTRGRERSRDPKTIYNECVDLFKNGYKEVTLLGQNVDSYRWNMTSKGEVKDKELKTSNFAQLLALVATVSPELRIRFSTSHPKDMSDEVIEIIASTENICNYIHLPIQSGNSNVLKRMNRGYDREWYLERIAKIRKTIPDCAITTDIITGFCDETNEEHEDTISIMKEAQWDFAYMYKYSERPKTLAERKFEDNVSEDVKGSRLSEVIELQQSIQLNKNKRQIGRVHKILVEGFSKRSDDFLTGRNDYNTKVVFPKKNYRKGDYVLVKITDCTTATLIGEPVLTDQPL